MDSINTQRIPGELPEADTTGFLIVRVYTARGGIPIEGAIVTVSSTDASVSSPIAVLTTDSSGKTSIIALPAPPRSFSLQPKGDTVYPASLPFSLYIVNVARHGFYEVTNINVRIFSGITAIQDIDLVPVSEALPRPYYIDESTVIDQGVDTI